MSFAVQGLLWCLTFAVLDAVQAVFFGGMFQRLDTFLVGLLVFGLTSCAALGCIVLRHPSQLRIARGNVVPVVGMNIAFALGWLSYLFSIQLIEPAVAFTVFTGMVPLTMIAASRFGIAGAASARNRFEKAGNLGLLGGIVVLCAITLAGLSGFVRGGTVIAGAGLVLAAAAGVFITWMLLCSKTLDREGLKPLTQFGLRFFAYLAACLAGWMLALDVKQTVPPGELAYAVLIGVLTMAFPIYAVQKAVSLVSPLTIGAFAAVSPLFVFGFQLIEGRIEYAPMTLVGLSVCFAGASVAVLGSSREPAEI